MSGPISAVYVHRQLLMSHRRDDPLRGRRRRVWHGWETRRATENLRFFRSNSRDVRNDFFFLSVMPDKFRTLKLRNVASFV